MIKVKKGPGGKLGRSEIIQARLDAKLRLAAEIMARSDRRTLSSFIESLIEQAAKKFMVTRNLFQPWWSEGCEDSMYSKTDTINVESAVCDIWNDHDSIRFLKFGIHFPNLLNEEEEKLFYGIIRTPHFWMHYPVDVEDEYGNLFARDWVRVEVLEGLVKENLRKYWDQLKAGKITFEKLRELSVGKKIPAPLREDPRAIEKLIDTEDPHIMYKKVFAWLDNNYEISLKDDYEFWEENAENLVTQKVEIRQTKKGPQIVTTLIPSSDEEQVWQEFLENKKVKSK
jgi:hypothetical protein